MVGEESSAADFTEWGPIRADRFFGMVDDQIAALEGELLANMS